MDEASLTQCEQEQLHRSGAIQPHGTLLVLGPDGGVSHAAANLSRFLDGQPADWLGRPAPGPLAAIAAEVGPSPGSRKVWEATLDGVEGPLNCVANRSASGTIVLELTPGPAESVVRPWSQTPPPVIADEAGLAEAQREITRTIAGLTGFQRVMYYRFREDGDGEVIAETRREEVYGSYLGLRFPASDIPRIARELYLKNPWRLIPDAAAEPVPILGLDATTPDLTWSDLRSVSPVHRVYLANMGVRASLSFPIVIGGGLSALIAAHHSEATTLPTALLGLASERVRAHAFAVMMYQSEKRLRMVDNYSRRIESVTALLQRHGAIETAWPELVPWLMEQFLADGVTLCIDDHSLSSGQTFEPSALAAFDHWFVGRKGDFVWIGDCLSRQVPDVGLSEVAGVLAMSIHRQKGRGLRLYFTRREHLYEVAWGGNPDKPVEFHDGNLGIAPRRSFERWVEKRVGYCRPWDNELKLLALRLREVLSSHAQG